MELRTLRYFVAVAEHESVSAAADIVRVTQPALSRQVRQLEHELKLALFDRRGGRLELTAAGRGFLPVARDVLHRAGTARSAAEAFAAGKLVHLTIAAPTTTLTDVIAPFLATFGPADPLFTVIDAPGIAALRHGADLAIVTRVPPPTNRRRALAVLPLWAYVPPGHRWARHDSVGLDELAGERLVLLDPSLRPRQILDEALEAGGLAAPEVVECGNAQIAQALAAAGHGIAVVSDDPRFGLHPLRVTSARGPLRITLHAAWDPGHHATDALATIAERLRNFCRDRYGTDVVPPEYP